MKTEGIIIFDREEKEWKLWVGHCDYWIQQGYSFELLIRNQYFQAFLEKDLDWFITLVDEVKLVLHINEVYKVRVELENFIKVSDPI
ncbi:hypothetical protein [Metabacillus sp. B2-18]|uniref:hypothetical protein n=1 Tax=Metabacillus sp. B2-18 TaxID=2897333 RepID=UPI001E64BF47|nr:hypothetical protein [Metabacillus sp. B2-18]UGB28782.1 hypothetical protein LPC09_13345 [Metabacillus sp. B2-18]UGB28911.1 hypothetical protein LPC09_14160 [Metabacillus sp. B2-18]UGB33670.1 hypothetical protein LPC09_25790 [Metabacillus sp. B2-18]UGB33758.1 hypothetical protein LPC09_26270 [Metabacillus sp. B2-18]